MLASLNARCAARARLKARLARAVFIEQLKKKLTEGGLAALTAEGGIDQMLTDDALEAVLTDETLANLLTRDELEALGISSSELSELNALHSSADACEDLLTVGETRPETLVLSMHPNPSRDCLRAWTLEEFQKFLDMADARSSNGEDNDALDDRVISTYEIYTCDADGRIAISAFLREKARLKGSILIVGRRKEGFEIWNPDLYGILEDGQRRTQA